MRATHRLLARRLRSRSGVAFVFAVIALGVMLILGLTMVRMGINDVKQAGVYKRRIQTMQLAEGALERCIWMMEADSNGKDDINRKLRGGSGGEGEQPPDGVTRHYYSPIWATGEGETYNFVAVYPYLTDNLALVVSNGRAANGQRESIRAVLRYIPFKSAVFGHALFSDHNLDMGGNVFVDGNPEAVCSVGHEVYPPLPKGSLCPIGNPPPVPDPPPNPDEVIVEEGGEGIYATGNIVFSGTPDLIGNAKATGSISGPVNQTMGTQEPFTSKLAFPEIDLAWYEANADVIMVGDQTISGGTLGTWDAPKIIFVDGLVHLSGTFTGVGTIVSTGGFKVTGQVLYADANSGLALLTTGNFRMMGTSDVYGLIYAHNVISDAEFFGAGTAKIIGAVAADVITTRGTLDVIYDRRLK
ncbi:MAG: hypothetical protein ACE5R4_14280, partial [Armatimonadota bacterium]